METINKRIQKLKTISANGYQSLFKQINPFGPGERVLYYLINQATLAGGSESGDIKISGNAYELKGTKVKNVGGTKYAYDFFLGVTIYLDDIKDKLFQLIESNKSQELNTTLLDRYKKSKLHEYQSIKKLYAERIYDNYFSRHDVILMDVHKSFDIILIKKIQPNDIDIERITGGFIKPLIIIK